MAKKTLATVIVEVLTEHGAPLVPCRCSSWQIAVDIESLHRITNLDHDIPNKGLRAPCPRGTYRFERSKTLTLFAPVNRHARCANVALFARPDDAAFDRADVVSLRGL